MYVRSALHYLVNHPMSWDFHILASLPVVMVANILTLVFKEANSRYILLYRDRVQIVT